MGPLRDECTTLGGHCRQETGIKGPYCKSHPGGTSGDDKGNYDSCIAFTWAIEPDYRRSGLSMLMYGETSRQAWKLKMRYTSAPVERENVTNKIVKNNLFLKNRRSHMILEKAL